jgi:tetratricopeptide (TPR) repeat protein
MEDTGPATLAPVLDGDAARLLRRAEHLLANGGYRQAARKLEEALRLPSVRDGTAAEEALLRLGDCHQHLGHAATAARTWRLLLERNPRSWRAHRRLGCLYLRHGRADLASIYLAESLRVLRAPTGPAGDRVTCALLLELSCAHHLLGDQEAAVARLNEAAEMDPPNPLPFVWLAYRAAGHGDAHATRLLLGTALARVPCDQRQVFVNEYFEGAASREGGTVLAEVLLENGLDPAACHRTTTVTRLSPA